MDFVALIWRKKVFCNEHHTLKTITLYNIINIGVVKNTAAFSRGNTVSIMINDRVDSILDI